MRNRVYMLIDLNYLSDHIRFVFSFLLVFAIQEFRMSHVSSEINSKFQKR